MGKHKVPKLIIPGLIGVAVAIATVQIKQLETTSAISQLPPKTARFPEASETSADPLVQLVESFVPTNTPVVQSQTGKPQVSRLSQHGVLKIPSPAEIIASHDRLMRGSLTEENFVRLTSSVDSRPLQSLWSWEEPLKIPSQAVIIANHDRLMNGLLAEKDNRLQTVQTNLKTVEPLKVEMILASKGGDRLSEDILPASRGGRKPSLDLQPSTAEREAFIPDRLPLMVPQGRSRISPSVSIGTPSAYGKSWRSASVGLGLQARTRFSNLADGGFGMGIGFGNGYETVGLDVGIGVADLLGDTARDGSISFKLHRRLPDDFAVAVGVNHAIRWGETDGGSSVYGVVTKMFRLREKVTDPLSRLYVSAGVGSGQFRSESQIQEDIDSLGVFGSVTLQVVPQANAIAEWTGQDLTLGLSVAPFQNLPLVITPAVTDITGNAGDGSRFILGIGYGFSF